MSARPKFLVRDIPEGVTIFSYLANKSGYLDAIRRVRKRHSMRGLLALTLSPRLVADLRAAVLDVISTYGDAGWRRTKGESKVYRGFSLVHDPNYREAIDPHLGSLGTHQLRRAGDDIEDFFWRAGGDRGPLKHSFVDTYGFRCRTKAASEGGLGAFLGKFCCSLIRSRVGILHGEHITPDETYHLEHEGWHREEPIFEKLRVNIPLQTDESYLFQLAGQDPRHLEIGKAYTWNTHQPHRVFCRGGAQLRRIHLVLGVAPWFDYLAEDDAWQVNEYFGELHPFEMLENGLVHPEIRAGTA